jgi:HSP20 family protein
MKKDLTQLSNCCHEPMSDLRKFFSTSMDSFFDNFATGFARNEFFTPKVNFCETDKSYELTAELPGIKKDDVKIDISNNTLTIKGHKKHEEKKEDKHYYRVESSYGEFYREFHLPKSVDHENVTAKFKDGILHMTVPKKKNDSKNIEIKVE